MPAYLTRLWISSQMIKSMPMRNVEEDIAKYGLYSYEEFALYITKEQYDAFNAQYMKIAVGKGDFNFEEILRMISEYLTEAN